MKLNLCWKTCERKIIRFFQAVSRDKTESEGRFLTEFFLGGSKSVHHTLLKSHFQTVYRLNQHTQMARDGFLFISNYDKANKLCRTYKLADIVRQNAFLYFFKQDISLYYKKDKFVCKLSNSEKVNQVMKKLMSSKIRFQVKTLEKLIEDASEQGRTIEPRIVSDTYNVVKMLARSRVSNDNSVLLIDRHVQPSEFGRIYEVDGGMQNLSRVSKKVNYSVDNYFNYDIRCCALSALSHYAKMLNIDSTVVDEYINDPSIKHHCAEQVGISVNVWKQCLLSAIFGAKTDGLGSIALNIRDEVGFQRLDDVYKLFVRVADPYLKVIKQWLDVVGQFARDNVNKDGMITNQVDCQMPLIEDGKQVNSKRLSAFYLQGLETAFIADLILESQNYFKIISYEFDGLVTEGRIPQHIIEKCKASSTFTNVILEIKDL